MNYHNPKLRLEEGHDKFGKIQWRSPSNIALIKYWGKHGVQLPRNPSISFTLDAAHTETILEYTPKVGNHPGIDLEFYFEGKQNDLFKDKIQKYLESLSETFPFLDQLKLKINSHNSFPHSSGIASSASSMSALALCLCSLEHQLFGTLEEDEAFKQKASFLSRLGSGSACRSVYATLGLWGTTESIPKSSDLYAIPYHNTVADVFKTFHDDILIVSKGEKAVSSRAGHALMEGNIYADNRYQQARNRLRNLLDAMEAGDLERFGQICENEALTLHALMMTSSPSYILMRPNTLLIIEKIREYRKATGHPLYFSLDAGPNLHLLYPDSYHATIQNFIQTELKPFCENGQIIEDKVGKGAIEF